MIKKVLVVLLVFGLFVGEVVAFGSDSRPRGLEDRGELSKRTFIHYRRGNAKPPWAGGGGKDSGSSKCYGFLARDAKWKMAEDYVVNTSGSGVVDGTDELAVVDEGVATWEAVNGTDIFGNGYLDNSAIYQTDSVDGVNVVAFGAYGDPGVIAVTTVWGYFGGPPQTRELVEWDMLFNTAGGWNWGDADLDGSVMDLANIATHELGHSAGLGDLYESGCSLETMYGYSSEGETSKRDLNAGDVTGITELYK